MYALPQAQVVVELQLAADATVGEAIRQSGLLLRYPQIAADTIRVGVFGKVTAMDARLTHGDRVEIYRPLTVDPKEARRRRVALRTARKSAG